ncbi:MAG: beta-ketoacyl-[acyl-carrier-protein] synthase family protein [Campylobacteraceae bacterium]|jgi:3-oxoacyl-[acyl-carrier-protein] synthase-1|nr:beta-ketoacyl-[acyl-carrier-protein] synthase family protein [Campylobacteraceae bacterium]
MLKNRVFVNHFDAVSCAGLNECELWQNILEQKSGIKAHEGFLPDSKAFIGKMDSTLFFKDLLLECTEKTVKQSKIETTKSAVFIGSSVGGMQNTEKRLQSGAAFDSIDPDFHTIGAVKNILDTHFRFQESFAFSTACTSSANAIGFAYECIKKGVYKTALVIGADAISLTTVCGFNALGVLSDAVCKPFCQTSGGMNVAEGIGLLVLSNIKTDNAVEILGVGYSSDAYHMTHPKPDGMGAFEAMSSALKSSGLTPAQIDYVNAHGTGTKANDVNEAAAINLLFGKTLHISSTKNIIGHTLGAAGALEAVITCKAILESAIPPNNTIMQSVHEECNFVLSPVKQEINAAMSNSFAFGGNNVSLIFGKVL